MQVCLQYLYQKYVPKHKITIYIQFSEDVVDSFTVSGESMGKKTYIYAV